jgi:hypothetical protein
MAAARESVSSIQLFGAYKFDFDKGRELASLLSLWCTYWLCSTWMSCHVVDDGGVLFDSQVRPAETHATGQYRG